METDKIIEKNDCNSNIEKEQEMRKKHGVYDPEHPELYDPDIFNLHNDKNFRMGRYTTKVVSYEFLNKQTQQK